MEVGIWRAGPPDREAILRLSSLIPGDFLEYVVDDWMAREPGGIYLAGAEGKVLACCALFFPLPGQGWLQGMRVHPDFRRHGIGARLTSYLLEEARDLEAERVGLLTAPGNLAARQMVEKLGFRPFHAARKILFFGSPRTNSPPPPALAPISACREGFLSAEDWAPAQEGDLPAAWAYLQESPVFRESQGYIFHPQYTFVPLTRPYFSELLRAGGVWLLGGAAGIRGLLILSSREEVGHWVLLHLDLPREELSAAAGLLARFIHREDTSFFSLGLLGYQFDALKDFFDGHLSDEDLEHWLIMERQG